MKKKPKTRRAPARRRKPLWTIKSGITQSALKLFLRCPEQFRLAYVEGWTSKSAPSKAISFGSIFHHLLASKEVKENRHTLFNFLGAIPRLQPQMLPKSMEDAEEIISLIAMMYPHYERFWAEEDSNQKWLAREKTFRIPFSWPSGSIDLLGRWDGVYKLDKIGRAKYKRLCVRDTKTKGKIDEDFIRNTLALDMQFMTYGRAAQGEFPAYTVRQLEIDVVRQPQQRRGVSDTIASYVTRVEADILDRPAWYFMRWKVDLAPGDISNWVRRVLRPAVQRLHEWWKQVKDTLDNPFQAPLHYMNPDALSTGWGRCTLFDLVTTGNTFMYRRKKVPFPELED